MGGLCCGEDMTASLSPPRKTAWLEIGSEGEDIYWSTCKGKGFLMECWTSGGMMRRLGYGAAMARVGCSFIELRDAGVGDAGVGCALNMMLLFWGARMPRVVGATVG